MYLFHLKYIKLYQLKGLMRPICRTYGHVFDIFFLRNLMTLQTFLQSLVLYRKLLIPQYTILLCSLNIVK